MDRTKKQQEREEQRQTPIVDGDARPDMPTNPQNEKSREKENRHPEKAGDKFESERQGDLNSLEDYKDAK